MKGGFLLTLCILGALAVAAVIGVVSWSGPQAVPAWRAAVSPGPVSARHAFLQDDCQACHIPYAGVTAAACVTCHIENEAVLARQSTAFHGSIDRCIDCHREHEGGARPTAMDHAVLVAFAISPRGDGRGRTLARRFGDQFAALMPGAPTADTALDCFGCHSNQNPHHDGDPAGCCAPIGPGTVGSLFGRDCAACHGTGSWKIAGFQHPSPRSTDCNQCHQPPPSHFMGHFEMVSKQVAGQGHARVEQCQLCHQTDAWNDIKGAGWYKHH